MSTLRMGMAALAIACTTGIAAAQTAAPADGEKAAPSATMKQTETEKPPLPGANSFTENQARERIAKAGFEEVQALKKDDQGVWRGQAKKSGQQVSVALDYRGNVVQQ